MDHAVVDICTSQISCGVIQLSRVNRDSWEKFVYGVCNYLYHPSRGSPAAMAVISSTVGDAQLVDWLEELRKHDLGSVYFGGIAINPRTGNSIWLRSWVFNHESMRKWWINYKKSRIGQ